MKRYILTVDDTADESKLDGWLASGDLRLLDHCYECSGGSIAVTVAAE